MEEEIVDPRGQVRKEKVIFVTEYKYALDRVNEMNARANQAESQAKIAEAAVQRMRAEQNVAYRKTEELLKETKELGVLISGAASMRINKASNDEEYDDIRRTIDGNRMVHNEIVTMEEIKNSSGGRKTRLRLNPPQREKPRYGGERHPGRLWLNPPKPEKWICMEEETTIRHTRLRLSQPKRESGAFGEESHKVCTGRVSKVLVDANTYRNGRASV